MVNSDCKLTLLPFFLSSLFCGENTGTLWTFKLLLNCTLFSIDFGFKQMQVKNMDPHLIPEENIYSVVCLTSLREEEIALIYRLTPWFKQGVVISVSQTYQP